MANRYYEPGSRRAEKVRDLFAVIAARYDLINDLQSFGLHRHWKQKLIDLARPGPGLFALDLCSGTGDIALGLAKRGASVVGLDFSEPMLAVAEARGREFAKENSKIGPSPRWLRGDAQNIPFPDNSFDAVTIAYGLRNLADWRRGLDEMLRVLRPNGTVLILEFGKPEFAPWRALYFFYLRWLAPIFGLVFCGDRQTHRYILESLQHYPAQHGVDHYLASRGAVEVRLLRFLGGAMTINLAKKPSPTKVDASAIPPA